MYCIHVIQRVIASYSEEENDMDPNADVLDGPCLRTSEYGQEITTAMANFESFGIDRSIPVIPAEFEAVEGFIRYLAMEEWQYIDDCIDDDTPTDNIFDMDKNHIEFSGLWVCVQSYRVQRGIGDICYGPDGTIISRSKLLELRNNQLRRARARVIQLIKLKCGSCGLAIEVPIKQIFCDTWHCAKCFHENPYTMEQIDEVWKYQESQEAVR